MPLMHRFSLYLLIAALAVPSAVQASTLVAQMPAISKDHVAFTWGGELWITGRGGGPAHRLTTGAGIPTSGRNAFSPAGDWLAYTATYGGDPDVYLIPVAGGQARRLTFDQKPDEAIGWSQDGQRVLFRSTRQTFYDGYGLPRVYAVRVEGGRPQALPFPVAYNVAYSGDGRIAAVEPQQLINTSWKQYRGGDQRQIRLVDPSSLAESRLPGPSANDFDPMWVGDTLYFLSDRDGRQSLYAYSSKTGAIDRLFDPGVRDIKSASLGPGAIVFAWIDGLGIYDLASGRVQELDITPIGRVPGREMRKVALPDQIADATIADDGTVAFQARGRSVLVTPSGGVSLHGDSAHVERIPTFTRDGHLSVFSDASGHYRLVTRDLQEMEDGESLELPATQFHNGIAWSPDGTRALVQDADFDFWLLEGGKPAVKLDSESNVLPWLVLDAAWSRDGRQVAYSRTLDNGLFAVFVWPGRDGRPEQVSPAGLDVRNPTWDADGRTLWYTASASTPPVSGYLSMSDKVRLPATRVVMSTRQLNGTWSRPLRAAWPASRYEQLVATPTPGTLLLLEADVPPEGARIAMPLTQTLKLVRTVEAGSEPLEPSVLAQDVESLYPGELFGRVTTTFRASPQGSQVLFRSGNVWKRIAISGGKAGKATAIALGKPHAMTDPQVEWRQMFEDAFRMLETYFADARRPDPDFSAWKARYAPMLTGLGSRQDLTYLLEDVAGELQQSHAGAETPMESGDDAAPAPTGALAVDVRAEGDRYRITRIYHSDLLRLGEPAPLDSALLNAREGDLIESIDGVSVSASRDLAEYLLGRAGKATDLCLSSAQAGRRCAKVVPTANESAFRFAAWREKNRRLVEAASGGRLGYIHLSDTIESGLSEFEQARFSQHPRDGFILDVRYNSGGYAADYVIQQMTAEPFSQMQMPHGRRVSTPGSRLAGPKVLLINAYCGSGCDTLAWYFSDRRVGDLIGTPTWGGVSGSGNMPVLMDGGRFSVPSYTMTDAQGGFIVEGEAVQPTLPVEISQAEMAIGHDPQLERAVSELLDELGGG